VGANLICTVLDSLFDFPSYCNLNPAFLNDSILRDLIPTVAQAVWGPIIDNSPVPTVTVASSHPSGNYHTATRWLLPGHDDGVLSMNSACGNPNPVFPPQGYAASGAAVTSLVKAFDMGLIGPRAEQDFKSKLQIQGGLTPPSVSNYLTGACTPYRSPNGMVMPIEKISTAAYAGSVWDTRNRYDNYYSFIQATADHGYDGASDKNNKWPSTQGYDAQHERRYLPFKNYAVDEETSSVTNADIFTRTIDAAETHLVKPIPLKERIRGRLLSFNMPFNFNGKCERVGFLNWYCKVWIWKRTYHLLDKWEKKQTSHYAYEFIGRR
jgi:hypothetical protein